MKELWFINHYAVTPSYSTGTRHYDLATELIKNDIAVSIFASNYTLALQNIPVENKFLKEYINGIKFYWIKTPIYRTNSWRRFINMLGFTLNLYRVGKGLGIKPNLIIGSSPHLFAAFGSYLLAKKLKSRFYLEIRDLWPLFLIEIGGYSKLNPLIVLMGSIENFLYKKAEKIIILAPGSKEYLGKKGIKDNKILFLPNGVHLQYFRASEDRDSLRKRYSFNKFTIIYTGAHGPANALDKVLLAAKCLSDNKNIEIVLVGSGVLKKELIYKATELNLDNLRFLEPVSKEKIPELLKAADAGLITLKNIPAFSYGVSPNKLFDYMAASLPVIAAVGGEVSELVVNSEAGIAIEPENYKKLANAIERVSLLSESEKLMMGNNGRKLVEKYYSRGKLADCLLKEV